jgi:hypothetical protein
MEYGEGINLQPRWGSNPETPAIQPLALRVACYRAHVDIACYVIVH